MGLGGSGCARAPSWAASTDGCRWGPHPCRLDPGCTGAPGQGPAVTEAPGCGARTAGRAC